jgi:pimeloyl-ACP methyl ester carboxylesterase
MTGDEPRPSCVQTRPADVPCAPSGRTIACGGLSIIDTSTDRLRGSHPGRLSTRELGTALAAPADADGFVSSRPQIGGLRLHVRQRVISGTATPCVLLHGLAVSHRYLVPTAGLLGFRSVYVPDLAGFGLSDKPSTVLNVGGHADIIATLLDTLGTAPVALLSNSFGCQVAARGGRAPPRSCCRARPGRPDHRPGSRHRHSPQAVAFCLFAAGRTQPRLGDAPLDPGACADV